MIKLLGLLFLFVPLFGQEQFLFPDDHGRFIHYLQGAFKSNPAEILIVTPSFNHAELKKGLLGAARRGAHAAVVVQDLKGDALSVVQYAGIDLYFYKARKLQGSTLIIGGRLLCHLPLALDEEHMGEQTSLIVCSKNAGEIAQARRTLRPLLNRSVLYLK